MTAGLVAGVALATLTGCSSFSTTASSPAVQGHSLAGTVHGGQQPISGSHVYLYAAGTTGYGSASSSLLTVGDPGVSADAYNNGYVTTDSSGNFTISSDYMCPSSTAETYLYAYGGNPGNSDPSTDNTAISLIAALGQCQNLTSLNNVVVSEVSTAVSITALQQFMVDPSHIGAPSGNSLGLQNAFALIPNLLDLGALSPRSTTLAGNGSVPSTKINTLGDILAPCVNSPTSTSPDCEALYTDATPPIGTAPDSVASAMLDIALYPANNTGPLLGLINSAAPFEPAYTTTSVPASYTLGVTYTGGGLQSPGDVSIDASGNAWIVNCPNCFTANGGAGPTGGTDSLVELGAQGAILSGSAGYTTNIHMPQDVTIGLNGNIWSTNLGNGGSTSDNVMQMTPTGGAVTGFPVSNSSIATPEQIAIDTSGNAWISNYDYSNPGGSGAVKLSQSGSILVPTVTSPGFSGALGLAIDNSGSIYMAGNTSTSTTAPSGSILKFDTNGTVDSGSGSGYTTGGINAPYGIAIDSGPHVWTVDNSNAVSEIFGNGGSGISGTSGYTNLGLYQAAVIAIDGNGTAWIPNCRSSCPGSGDSTDPDNIVHVSDTGAVIAGASGYQDTNFSGVGVPAIDASGNLWITNNVGNSVTELLGVAVPVDTPIAQQVKNATVGKPAGTT